MSGRLVDMPERDLKEALTQLARSSDDVILPLPLRYGPRLDDAGRQRLAAAARIIRQTDRNVMVLANLPTGPAATEATLCQATQWALQISRALSEREAIPADRLTAIGRVTPPEAAETVSEPTATLVLRPKAHYAKADVAHDPLHQKPVSQSQIVR